MPTGITLAVNLQNITYNAAAIKKYCGESVKVCAMVKANAYGHGIEKTAARLKENCDFFGVARLCEAQKVRKVASATNILICAEFDSKNILPAVKNNFTLSVSSFMELQECDKVIKKLKRPLKLHIKIDSGMNRLGIKNLEELKNMLNIFKQNSFLRLKGIFTHFADCLDSDFTKKQYNRFMLFVNCAKDVFPDILAHCASSVAIFSDRKYHLDMVRPGINIYGYCREMAKSKGVYLKPAMEVYSTVIAVKEARKGETIGYMRTYTAKKTLSYVVIGAGYGDGYKRILSGRGIANINGFDCYIAGSVCMDSFMAVLPENAKGKIKAGDRVLLMSDNASDNLTFDYFAKLCNTIEYELLTSFTQRVQRIYK